MLSYDMSLFSTALYIDFLSELSIKITLGSNEVAVEIKTRLVTIVTEYFVDPPYCFLIFGKQVFIVEKIQRKLIKMSENQKEFAFQAVLQNYSVQVRIFQYIFPSIYLK